MVVAKTRKLLCVRGILAETSHAWATDLAVNPAGTKCSDLLNMQIDNATLSEASSPHAVGSGAETRENPSFPPILLRPCQRAGFSGNG